MERLHLRVKAVAESIDNTTAFERSVITGVINRHLRSLESAVLRDHLRGRARTHPQFPNVELSYGVVCGMKSISVTDVVFLGDAVGEVYACARSDGAFFVLVDVLEIVAPHRFATLRSVVCKHSGGRDAWPIAELRQARFA